MSGLGNLGRQWQRVKLPSPKTGSLIATSFLPEFGAINLNNCSLTLLQSLSEALVTGHHIVLRFILLRTSPRIIVQIS